MLLRCHAILACVAYGAGEGGGMYCPPPPQHAFMLRRADGDCSLREGAYVQCASPPRSPDCRLHTRATMLTGAPGLS